MNEEKRCAQCGAVLAADAPQGLCPACLLKRGFATSTGGGESDNRGSRTEYVPPPPAELARYFPELEILGMVGRGGMGVVYKARQKRLDRLVALKILPSNVSCDAAFSERFTREAKALARLTHPNIVSVHDFGQTDGLFYFVMEFVDGMNLRQLLDPAKIAPKEALAIVPQICDALQYAHDKGIVHRDIKPENILIDKSGVVKIADFGLAKLVGLEAKDLTITSARDVIGTPHYMAPEQIEHPQDVDHRADIYSLGVVFYQMLTGELPIGRFAPPSRKVQIDVRLDEVVLRALEKEPEHRYQHASDVKTHVETIATSSPQRNRAAQTGTPLFPVSFGLVFKSRLALRVARTGWVLGCLAALGFVPALKWMFGFAGFFGLIGAAVLIELIYRIQHGIAIGTSAAPGETQRFSPTAIVGAVWCAFSLVGTLPFYFPQLRPVQEWIPLALMLAAMSFTGVFGTTILGWLAVSRIRRSGGKLYGLPLAVFDGMLFPILALDAAIFGLAYLIVALVVGLPYYSGSGDGSFGGGIATGYEIGILFSIWLGTGTILSLVADFLIIRRVWRAVNRPVASSPSTVQKPDRFWRWFTVTVVTLIASAFVILPLLMILTPLLISFYAHHERAQAVNQQNPQPTAAMPNQQSLARSDGAQLASTNFYVGQTYFPQGDSIEITSVERTDGQMTVKGRYNLVSYDNALLALYVTTTNNAVAPEDAEQRIQISKGRGDFVLIHSHLVPGPPHVSMYADGHPFAALYFGTKAEALEESQASWITNAPASTASRSPALSPSQSAGDTGRRMGSGNRDNIDLPFVNDPQVIGEWASVDFVTTMSEFDPERRYWSGDLYLKGLTFLDGGRTPQPWWTWTKGILIHNGDQTASHYEIRDYKGQNYLFLEWKSGDVTIRGMKPSYYVLRKKSL